MDQSWILEPDRFLSLSCEGGVVVRGARRGHTSPGTGLATDKRVGSGASRF